MKLKAPLVAQKAEKMDKVVKATGEAAIKAQKDFAAQSEPKGVRGAGCRPLLISRRRRRRQLAAPTRGSRRRAARRRTNT